MIDQIECILFDMGGTLRSTTHKSQNEKKESIRQIMDLLGVETSVDGFSGLLSERAGAYKHWCEETLIELNEGDLWTLWMLPDWPKERIEPLAVQLNQMYREAIGTRTILPETYEVVLELFRRGYRLGLVSNTTSSVEVPAALNEMKLTGCFEVVLLSTVLGKRKPDPEILLNAVSQMGVTPEKCAYIGDRVDRDVAVARKAGFLKAIIIGDQNDTPVDEADPTALIPDNQLKNLNELLDIFPGREPYRPSRVYKASLSTMWAMENFPTLPDFFEFARRAGFASIELNHKVTSAMIAGVDLEKYPTRSIHEPCPADISVVTLKEDWLISSINEENRRKGVQAIQRTIDFAHRLGVKSIVVHSGRTQADRGLEKQLQALFKSGQKDSDQYREIQNVMIKERAALAARGLEAVKQSIRELLAYAEPFGVQIGLENLYHFMEYPSPDEMGTLLNLARPDQLGIIFDVGHAQHLSKLGFYPFEEWLERYSTRIIGTHLHDMVDLKDHYAAGLGNVDLDTVARYLPENAFRTCEFMGFNTPSQVKAGLIYLFDHGCIEAL